MLLPSETASNDWRCPRGLLVDRPPPPKHETIQADIQVLAALQYTDDGKGKRFGGTLPAGLEEHDIRSGLGQGGSILGIFVVESSAHRGPKYVAYIRTSWKRSFFALRTYRGRSNRMYRDLDRLVRLIRDEFRYRGPITIHIEGAPELRRFRAFVRKDGADAPVGGRSGSTPFIEASRGRD